MFQRWLRCQQPTWLIGTFFVIAIAIESQAPYHKSVRPIQESNHGHLREAEASEGSVEIVEANR